MLHSAELQPCSTGNQNGGCNTGNICSLNLNSCLQQKSNSHIILIHIIPVYQHDETTVDTLTGIGMTGKCRMAAIYRKYIRNNQSPRCQSIQPSLIVLLDPGNVGVAVGISLLSYIQAEIYVTAYVLPVNGSHV
jgi:hypothetical protein